MQPTVRSGASRRDRRFRHAAVLAAVAKRPRQPRSGRTVSLWARWRTFKAITLLQQQLSSIIDAKPARRVAAILGRSAANRTSLYWFVIESSPTPVASLIDSTQSMLIVEWPIAATSLQTGLSPLLRSFASMPDAGGNNMRVNPTDPAAQSIRVSVGTIEGHPCVSMISHASWTTEVELNMSVAAEWVLAGKMENEQDNLPELVKQRDARSRCFAAGTTRCASSQQHPLPTFRSSLGLPASAADQSRWRASSKK